MSDPGSEIAKAFGVTRVGGFLPEESPDPNATGWTPPALPRGDGGRWPSWIETGIPNKANRSSPERAVLARTADRVWFLAPDDTAFIPLALPRLVLPVVD